MRHLGYSMSIEEMREFYNKNRFNVISDDVIDVSSELDKSIFCRSEITGNPVSIGEASQIATNAPEIFGRYGLDGAQTGTRGVDDADFVMSTMRDKFNETESQHLDRLQDIAFDNSKSD